MLEFIHAAPLLVLLALVGAVILWLSTRGPP